MADGSDEANGWLGIYPDDLRFLREVPAPRRGSYLRQLRYNLRCFLPWALLGPATGALVVGVWQGWWPLAGCGAVWLAGYFYLSWTAAAILRDGRLRCGEVFAQPPLAARKATEAEAVLPGGESVRASFPARPFADLIADLIERYGRAEVLILTHPAGAISLVVGARPPDDPSSDGGTAEPAVAPDPRRHQDTGR